MRRPSRNWPACRTRAGAWRWTAACQYWLRKAAQDVGQAHIARALHYETIHVSPPERAHAPHWLKVCAENGYFPAYNEIGCRLMMTVTGEAHPVEAFG